MEYMLNVVMYNGSWRTGGEIVIVECLCNNQGHDGPRNIVSLQKIQKERYDSCRERGKASCCENRNKYNLLVRTGPESYE